MRGITITLAVVAAGISQAAGFNFTFDNNNQNWTRGDFGDGFANINTNSNGPATWVGGGEFGGYIAGTDHGPYAYHFSPNLGGGHGALFGQTLSFDFRSAGNGGEDPLLVLMSSTDFLVVERTVTAGTSFTNWQFSLDNSTNFYFNSSQYHDGASAVFATNTDIQNVLSDLRFVGISTDITGGGDTTRLDNVSAEAVPEPATMTILGLATLAALRKKHKA